jgi:hypothetical protein
MLKYITENKVMNMLIQITESKRKLKQDNDSYVSQLIPQVPTAMTNLFVNCVHSSCSLFISCLHLFAVFVSNAVRGILALTGLQDTASQNLR